MSETQVNTQEAFEELMERKIPIGSTLVGTDGNAFALLGKFKKEARKAGWEKEDIDLVIKHAMSGNYDALVYTLQRAIE